MFRKGRPTYSVTFSVSVYNHIVKIILTVHTKIGLIVTKIGLIVTKIGLIVTLLDSAPHSRL